VIALAAGENAVAIFLAAFEVKLPREFYRGFGGFGAAGSEIDAAAVTEIRRSQSEQALGKFFSRSGMKLRSMRQKRSATIARPWRGRFRGFRDRC